MADEFHKTVIKSFPDSGRNPEVANDTWLSQHDIWPLINPELFELDLLDENTDSVDGSSDHTIEERIKFDMLSNMHKEDTAPKPQIRVDSH
jgi:hypothetical protein